MVLGDFLAIKKPATWAGSFLFLSGLRWNLNS
jgi:hypothetical protein